MQNKLIIQRIPQLMIGLFLCGFGLAFTIEAGLGLNSWDVFHDGFSKLIGVKIGFAGVLTGFILLLGWIPLRQKPFIGTILNILTIGNVIDLTMYYLPSPEILAVSIRVTRIGIDFTAFVVGVLLGGSYGLGTIFMVVTVGPIVQYSLKRFDRGAIFSL